MAQAQQPRTLTNLTADDLDSLPADIGRFELIEEEIVPSTPAKFPDGMVAFKFGFVLGLFNMQHKLGVFLTAETGFFTRKDRKTVRAPGLAFISYRRLPLEKLADEQKDFGKTPPDFVVEVVSPNDRASEVEAKVREWLNFGVALVWVVYPESQSIHVFTSAKSAQIFNAEDTITGGEVFPSFEAPVRAFFED